MCIYSICHCVFFLYTRYVHTCILVIQVNVKVRSEYTTDNGQRDYTDSHSTTTNELHYDIPLLTPGSVYSVDVTAHTSEGSGPTTSLDVTLDEGREGKCTS